LNLYLDTSSLVKLYVAEQGSDAVETLIQQADAVATSGVAYPEARAAFARRRRERALRPADHATIRRAFDDDWPRYVVVDVSSGICRQAGDLAERYRLRGFDSVHLASFAELLQQAVGVEVTFSSFDDGLNRAARSLVRSRRRGR
jgi:predicted nucleic acid-binding protein